MKIPVVFTPNGSAGIQSAEVRITSNDPDETNPDRTLAISGHAWKPDGLSMHWPLDDAGPPNVVDVSGNALNGTFVDGETWIYNDPPIAGSEGKAVTSIDGSTYMLAEPPHTPSFTYSVWVKPESGGVLFHQTLDLQQRSKSMFDVEIGADGNLIMYINETELFFTDPETVPLGEVTHIVITHLDSDGFGTDTADRTRLYINGKLHSEVQGAGTAELPVFPEDGPSNNTLYVGVSLLGGGILRGTWDDLQRYDLELPEDEVASMFANPGATAGLDTLPFQIVDVSVDEAGINATITWTSKPGRMYTLERSVDFGTWLEVDDGIEASEGETTTTEDELEVGTSEIYYRVIQL